MRADSIRSLLRGDSQLQFLKDDGTQHVATRFTITWPNEPAPALVDPLYGVLGAIKLSHQEFIAGQPLPIDLCQGKPEYGLVPDPDPLHPGQFVLVLKKLTFTPPEAEPDLVPGGTIQYGCVYDRDVVYPDADTIGVTELIYLEGDWGASRN